MSYQDSNPTINVYQKVKLIQSKDDLIHCLSESDSLNNSHSSSLESSTNGVKLPSSDRNIVETLIKSVKEVSYRNKFQLLCRLSDLFIQPLVIKRKPNIPICEVDIDSEYDTHVKADFVQSCCYIRSISRLNSDEDASLDYIVDEEDIVRI